MPLGALGLSLAALWVTCPVPVCGLHQLVYCWAGLNSECQQTVGGYSPAQTMCSPAVESLAAVFVSSAVAGLISGVRVRSRAGEDFGQQKRAKSEDSALSLILCRCLRHTDRPSESILPRLCKSAQRHAYKLGGFAEPFGRPGATTDSTLATSTASSIVTLPFRRARMNPFSTHR